MGENIVKSISRVTLILIASMVTVASHTQALRQDLLIPRQPQLQVDNSNAQRTWKQFYESFRTAVRRRDKLSLRTMMVSDFLLNSEPRENEKSSIDTAFHLLDEKQGLGWRRLDRSLAQGVGLAKGYRTYGSDEFLDRPHMVSPTNSLSESYNGWSAVFAYGRDERWYWVGFLRFIQ
jgi:hypothetical protein